ncbi:MAG: hypothetical protein KJZ85_09635 [Rhodobacteraceae bacterium]|jgi:hypothetical protein|nr:hypothetical protein [Paracoccaceae bacterium]
MSDEPEGKGGDRAARRRLIYVRQRLVEMKAEMKALREERAALKGRLGDTEADEDDDA